MRKALMVLLAVVGCNPSSGGPAPGASATGQANASGAPLGQSAAAPVGIPIPADKVAKVVNPKGEAPYAGATGTLKGTIRYKGEPAPLVEHQIPAKCGEAAATYGKLFRVGQDGTLADVLVAATGYEGFVPAADEAEKLTLHGCAAARRTVAMAFGQRLEVFNLDKIESYMPYLDGSTARAVMVAIPGGDAVKLYPQQPGHYMLRDQLPKPFMTADVYALAYATHDVTGLDGQYEIKGIPVGKVRVNAFLPAIDVTTGNDIEIKEGENKLDLTIEWKGKRDAATPATPKK